MDLTAQITFLELIATILVGDSSMTLRQFIVEYAEYIIVGLILLPIICRMILIYNSQRYK